MSLENPVTYTLLVNDQGSKVTLGLGTIITDTAADAPAVAFPPVVALPAPQDSFDNVTTHVVLQALGGNVTTWDYTNQLNNSDFITSIGVVYDLTYGPKSISSVGTMTYAQIVGGARATSSGAAIGCATSGLCQGGLQNGTWVAPPGQALIGIRTIWGPISWTTYWQSTNWIGQTSWNSAPVNGSTLLSIMFISAALSDTTHSNPIYSPWYGSNPSSNTGLGVVETYYAYQHFITGFAFRAGNSLPNPPSAGSNDWQSLGIGALTALRFSALPYIMSGESSARELAYCNGTQTDDMFSAAGYSNAGTIPYNSYNSQCVTAGAAYCATALNDPACVPFCKVYDCTAIGQAYTRDKLAAWQAANPSGLILSADGADDTFLSAYPESACFLESKFYTDYFNSMRKLYDGMESIADIPACAFTPCATSDRKPLNITCPANQSCITISNVENDGTINGAFSSPTSSTCQLRSDVSPAAPAAEPAGPAGPAGPAAEPAGPAAASSSDRYVLVVIIVVLLLVAALVATNKKQVRQTASVPAAANLTPDRPIET